MEDYKTRYPTTKDLKPLHSYDTELCADSIEWCPHNPFKNYFVCANYQLKPHNEDSSTENKRTGRILWFCLSLENELKLQQVINTEAVLDQKWYCSKINNTSLLAVANAINQIQIYKVNEELYQLELVTVWTLNLDSGESETLILSLDWSSDRYDSQTPEIICSDSKGSAHLLTFDDNKLTLVQSYHGHEYESWIACFYHWHKSIFFTGGDDCKLLKYDLRVGNEPILQNRVHEAGVTSLHTNSKREYCLASGSYDTYLRIWDIRKMNQPQHSLQLPGTLWRLKWDPFDCNHLLAACMSGGVHVVSAIDKEAPKVVESFYQHDNLAYGVDWSYLDERVVNKYCDSNSGRIIASCSFYDHLLCVYKIK